MEPVFKNTKRGENGEDVLVSPDEIDTPITF